MSTSFGRELEEIVMGSASYGVKRTKDGWAIEHDGLLEGAYISKESAFEVIAMAASNAIKEGHEVRIHIPGRVGDEAALGTKIFSQ